VVFGEPGLRSLKRLLERLLGDTGMPGGFALD
jgi:hypothetical protein